METAETIEIEYGTPPNLTRIFDFLAAEGFELTEQELGGDPIEAFVLLVDPSTLVSECDRLVSLLSGLGVVLGTVFEDDDEGSDPRPVVNGSYDPGTSIAMIEVYRLSDASFDWSGPRPRAIGVAALFQVVPINE